MIALRVKLNGTLLCVAGADDLSVLNAIVNAVGNLGIDTKKRRDEPTDIYLSVGGLTSRLEGDDEHLRWAEQQPLAIGDKIEVEVLEINIVDEPTARKPAEREDEREKLRYEHAKETYLRLRSKFESEPIG
jgi:hypothetical protein